jgi:hypothetical protein
LNKNISISTEQINSLRQQLDEQTSFTSKLALEKENEITELNKFINDSVQANNNKMLQREQAHMERINEYEINKANLINSHNVIKKELEKNIENLSLELSKTRKEAEANEMRLMNEINSLKEEINHKNQEHSLMMNEMQRRLDILREESEIKLADTIKAYTSKINDIEKKAFDRQQILESTNADYAQQIGSLNKDNNQLNSEKEMITNEFIHADKNLKDATSFNKNLQEQVLQERLAKEDCQKSNYELKQNEMSLIQKVDQLNREKINLQNQLNDANNRIAVLSDEVKKLNI